MEKGSPSLAHISMMPLVLLGACWGWSSANLMGFSWCCSSVDFLGSSISVSFFVCLHIESFWSLLLFIGHGFYSCALVLCGLVTMTSRLSTTKSLAQLWWWRASMTGRLRLILVHVTFVISMFLYYHGMMNWLKVCSQKEEKKVPGFPPKGFAVPGPPCLRVPPGMMR